MASIGNDLATIREQQQKTLEDIHDATKIPLDILQGIEDGTIFTNFEDNKTYIRSYIRSYGKELNIDEEHIIEALDDYELGSYEGELLDHTNIDPKKSSFTYDAKAEADEMEADKDEPKTKDEDTVDKESRSREEEKETSTHISTFTDDTDTSRATSSPSVSSIDWADLGRRFKPLDNKSRVWVGIALVLIVLAAIIGYWFYQNSNLQGLEEGGQNQPATQNLSQPAIVPDSLQLDLSATEDTAVQAPSQPQQVSQALGDTLHLLIYAAYNRLDPVRVHSDQMAGFNPYWIEQGQALRFEFVDFIRIRGQYSNMELLMNGHPIENFNERFLTSIQPDSQYVEIQRSLFEGDPTWLQPAPDSTELDFPLPSSVMDRPSFPTIN
ncbi:helix-turn-helix domain-containing protein [Aliifodinibius sp. S!AR15-10]|uniref:helix-turn-helix domain-containing protein n=1 Tax=Aliifodinibius sp. S!AR15-10 TaxID=2950437 RepID=UPI00285D1730|nr:helix-turn-helix domain-containing protein [Aliifodinibius sp. S!AR15-10]MDR8391766.1 helix-turn-helix domain-containing protein [Aliifodinibius sp. S!AR15-10]